MAVVYSFPVGNNTYVPNTAATDDLIIAFSRNPSDFPFMDYLKIVPVTQRQGLYWRLLNQQATRVRNANGAEFIWADGNDRPTGTFNLESFGLDSYSTQRYAFDFVLGDQAVEQASWPVLQMQSGVSAQQCMTLRGMQIQSSLSNATWGTNASAVDGGLLPAGQNWSNGTATQPHIKSSFNQASILINKNTQGVVQPRDMICVVSPDTARLMGESAEVHEYVRNGQFSMPTLQGSPQLYDEYGVPKVMYGHPIVIDDTVTNSAQKGSNPSFAYTIPLSTAYFITRKGGLVGADYARSFDTVQMFAYEEFTMETKSDPDNRRTMGSVVTDYQIVTTSPLSGFYFTLCVSSS